MAASERRDIVGRVDELTRVRRFLDYEDGPGALVIAGEAGIGKTALWETALDSVVGDSWVVLACRPTSSEAQFSFAALGDLLEHEVEESIRRLPEPQAHALAAALLLEESGKTPEPRTAGVATLTVLRELAAKGPVLVAIDDCQWLDPASAGALAYAVRRLRAERVVVLETLRIPHPDPLALERERHAWRFERLELGPLDADALHTVIRSRLGVAMSRPTMLAVHEITGGNPFFAVELARSLPQRDGRVVVQKVPVPHSLLALVEDRIAALDAVVPQVLAAVSALALPTLSVLEAAFPTATAALDVAERADIIRVRGDRVRFTHPLLARAALEMLTRVELARLHRLLAEVVADAEQRARHLAEGVPAPNENVADELERAAAVATARGASRAASELLEQAIRFTPEPGAASRRRKLHAARQRFAAGDQDRARELFAELQQEAPSGPERARVLLDAIAVSEWAERAVALAQEAIAEAGGDGACLADAHRWLALASTQGGDLMSGLEHARLALQVAEQVGHDDRLVVCMGTVALLETYTATITPRLLEHALELEDRILERSDSQAPSVVLGTRLMWSDRLAEGKAILEDALRRAGEEGNEPNRAALLMHLTSLETRAGNWARAAAHAAALYELDAQVFGLNERSYFARSLVNAHLGRVEDVRATLAQDEEEALGIDEATRVFQVLNRWVLGFLELSLGDTQAAAQMLRPLPSALERMGYRNPGVRPLLPDAIEALLGVGELEEARAWAAKLADQGRGLDNPWAMATAARCFGLASAAEGDVATALADFADALHEHERSENPFERARTLLGLGTTLRRAKRKREAREVLTEALETFDILGAALWAERTSAELARIGGRQPSDGRLTPTELRVAELVAHGKSNKEIAQALFVTVRTVETHVRHIRAKLGVRSRAGLAGRIARETLID